MSDGAGRIIGPQELQAHRDFLLRFAMLQLRSRAQAEDAVQETLLAAIEGGAPFAGKSSVRSWLVGILKHKIVDSLRKSGREESLDTESAELQDPDLDPLFGRNGRLLRMPADWGDPEEALQRARFFEVLQSCMEGLPRNTARAFAMREVLGMETAEICSALGVSVTNCNVLLFRARARLRACLEQKWFLRESANR